ncbi:MAG: hypothetical protein H6833_12280 [Planctomycetes bacterium]|nr:hypothetical protein [Planctomycetota bacterium]
MKKPVPAPIGALCLAFVCSGCVAPPTPSDRDASHEREIETEFPNQAALWRLDRYRSADGSIPERAWQRALEQRRAVVEARALAPESSAGVSSLAWTSRGPANVAGRARSIVIDPRNTQHIWVGSVSGGLWRSQDGGATWSLVDDWWSNLSVPTVAMDPNDPDVLYVGTGEGFYSLAHLSRNLSHFVRGAGILKSTDGGTTWTHLAQTTSWQHVTRIAVSPLDPNVVLASRRPGGIARSADGGLTWTDVATGDFSYQVLFDPNDGNRAVAHIAPTSALAHGVLTSSDGGQTWQPAASGLTSVAGEDSRIELAYAPSSPGVVYASCGANGGRIWRSADGGTTWVQRSDASSTTGVRYYYDGFWVDPTNENVLVVSSVYTYRSTDGGRTVTQISGGYIMTTDPHPDVHAVVADPNYDGASNRRVYLATDGGLHVTDDILTVNSAAGWRDLDDTMRSTQFYGAAGHATGDTLVGGTQDNGTLRVQGSSPFANLTFGGDGGQVQIDPTNPSYVYGEYQYLGVHRSSNGGASSRAITSGLGDFGSGNSNFISPLRLDPNEPRRLYAGGRSLWRTTNARNVSVGWTSVKNDVGSLISAIAITPGNPNVVYTGHNDGRLYRTTNATVSSPSWTALDDNAGADPLPNRVLTRLVVDALAPNTVYATFGGFASDNVWRSLDAGNTWQPRLGTAPFTLPDAPVYGLAIHPDDSNALYVATEVGVFTSDDAGLHWTTTNAGPANVVCEEITFMHGNVRRLVLATLGRGLWTADVVRPMATPFGSACAGQASPPRLDVDARAPARIGRTMTFLGTNLAIGPPSATLILGLSNQTWAGFTLPLALDPLGMTGCQQLVSLDITLSSGISPAGDTHWNLPLPDDHNLLGLRFFAQILAIDPGANAVGLVVSPGLEIGIGW